MNKNGANVSLYKTPVTMSKKSVPPSGEANHCLCVFVGHDFSGNNFFGKTIC